MADKMMRIAGRGKDGLAKALKTNNSGNLEVITNTTEELVTSSVAISNDTPFISEYISVDDYLSMTLVLTLSSKKSINVSVRNVRKQGDIFVAEDTYALVYKSVEQKELHTISFDAKTSHVQIKIEMGEVSTPGTIRQESYIVKSVEPAPMQSVYNLKEGTATLTNNGTIDISFLTNGYSNFTLSLYADSRNDLTKGEAVRIQYVDYYTKGEILSIRLLGELLESQQPQLVTNSTGNLSSGITSKIPILSELSARLRLVNLTGPDVTFRYLISGYIN